MACQSHRCSGFFPTKLHIASTSASSTRRMMTSTSLGCNELKNGWLTEVSAGPFFLGWQTELKQVSLKLGEIGCRIVTKATTERALLALYGQCMAEVMPGVEGLGGYLPGREEPQPRGSSSDQSYRSAQYQSGRGTFAPGHAPLVVAMRAKVLLQVVIGPRQLRDLIAMEQAWPVTARNLEEVRQRRGERPGGSLVPRHRAQQAAQATLHSRSCALLFIGEDVGSPIDPAIGDAHGGPQGGGRRQAPLEDTLQPSEGLWQGPLFSTRSRLSAMAPRRSWSLRPEATTGGRPSFVRALRTARQYPLMTSASGSVRPESWRSMGRTPRTCFLSSFLAWRSASSMGLAA